MLNITKNCFSVHAKILIIIIKFTWLNLTVSLFCVFMPQKYNSFYLLVLSLIISSELFSFFFWYLEYCK